MAKPRLDRAVEPHENVLIGNFIYALGLRIGVLSQGAIPPGCINLLQQTPNDWGIGDFLAAYPGAARILEFKRSTNDSDKESTKLVMLQGLLNKYTALEPVSRGIHWYIESLQPNSIDLETLARPYLELENRGVQGETDLFGFTEQFAKDVLADGPPRFALQDVQEYLRLLPEANGSKTTSAGGLVVCMNKETGLSYMPVRDFRELSLTFGDIRNDYAQQLELERERTLEHTQSISMGMSR